MYYELYAVIFIVGCGLGGLARLHVENRRIKNSWEALRKQTYIDFTHPVTGERVCKPVDQLTQFQIDQIIRTCEGVIR